jgi:hypothetical protein
MVCGIYWLPDGIAINIHQFRSLFPKCKSSINGSLQRLGFSTNLGRTAASQTIASIFPFLRENMPALRKWTVRRYSPEMEDSLLTRGRPLFEISLDGLGKSRAEPDELPGIEFDCDFEESISLGDARWRAPRDGPLDTDLYSISDSFSMESNLSK